MGDIRYMISDASKMLNVESHVLRYWEEELEINIPRNEMGHRYYTQFHVNLLRNVRDFKKQGYGLRAIKMMLSDPKDTPRVPQITVERVVMPEEKNVAPIALGEEHDTSVITPNTNTKLEQFQEIMTKIVANALKETTTDLKKDLSQDVSESVLKGVNYIMRVQNEKEEERFKKLDETLRSKQKLSNKKEIKKKLKAEKLLLKKEKKKKSGFGIKKQQAIHNV